MEKQTLFSDSMQDMAYLIFNAFLKSYLNYLTTLKLLKIMLSIQIVLI